MASNITPSTENTVRNHHHPLLVQPVVEHGGTHLLTCHQVETWQTNTSGHFRIILIHFFWWQSGSIDILQVNRGGQADTWWINIPVRKLKFAKQVDSHMSKYPLTSRRTTSTKYPIENHPCPPFEIVDHGGQGNLAAILIDPYQDDVWPHWWPHPQRTINLLQANQFQL